MNNEMILVKFNYSEFKPYLDKSNAIVQHENFGADGGDSAHRYGTLMSCLVYIKAPKWVDGSMPLDLYSKVAYFKYRAGLNKFRRHPDQNKWYSRPNNFSRDQTMMLQDAFLSSNNDASSEIFWQIIKRFGFHQNTHPNYANPGEPEYKEKIPDFIHPSQVSTYIRSTKNLLLYPILLITDLVYLIDIPVAMYDDYKSKKKGKRTDQYTMLGTNIVASEGKMPTPWFFLAKKVLKFVDYRGAIDWIFGVPAHHDPPVHKLLSPVLQSIVENRPLLVEIGD